MNCRIPSGIAALVLFTVAGVGTFLCVMNPEGIIDGLASNRHMYIRFLVPGRELDVPGRLGVPLLVIITILAFWGGIRCASYAWLRKK